MQKRLLIVLMSIVLFIPGIVPARAQEVPQEVMQVLNETEEGVTGAGQKYNFIVVPEEEAQAYAHKYTVLLENPKVRNIFPNLVIFSYTHTPYSVTFKAQNIAIDSLDFLYGYINLYNMGGLCGECVFSFTRIPPMQSAIIHATSYRGEWLGGSMFADATDGTVTNNGIFHFSR